MKKLSLLILVLFSTLLFAAAGDRFLINTNQDKDLILQVNKGGVQTNVMTIKGQTEVINLSGELNRNDPRVFATRSNTQALTESAVTYVTTNVEDIDSANAWNGTQFTAPKAGTYMIQASGTVIRTAGTAVAGDFFNFTCRKNSTDANYAIKVNANNTANTSQNFTIACIVSLAASDTLGIVVTENIAGASTFTGSIEGTQIAISKL